MSGYILTSMKMKIKRDKNKELEKLLHIVLQKYPELKKYNFGIRYNYLSDAYALFTIEDKKVDIEIDNDLKDKNEKLKIAAIASELSHIIKEKRLSLIPLGLGNYIEGLIYDMSKIYRDYDEKQTDIETVRRGFGKELLELLKYDDKDTQEKSEGLSVDELETILGRF